jgi:hypothetical protein
MMSAELSEAADKPRLVHSSEWQEPQLTSLRIDDGDTPHEFHLAVACMTKHPSNFPTWLLYHRRMVGVEHFFLRVEDTPVLEKFLSTEPWSTFVTVDSAHSTVRDWEGQTNRQCEHVRRSIKAARNAGITHLLHIDDDELLYLPHGFNLLRATILRAPAETADFHCLNLEAMAPSIDCVNPFVECTAFRHCSSDYCAYGGGLRSKGKSIGVVGKAALWPLGPHHFVTDFERSSQDDDQDGGKDRTPREILPCPVAVVLHYESCRFSRWRDKFCDYARRARSEGKLAIKSATSFTRFYRESIATCMQMVTTREADRVLLGHYSCADAEEAARKFWSAHKLEPAVATARRPVTRVETLAQHRMTLLPPVAAPIVDAELLAAEAACGMVASCTAVDGSTEIQQALAPASSLRPPRARQWRVCHTSTIVVREAPSMKSRMLDFSFPGHVHEVDAQTADGEWLRLRKPYHDGVSGWLLIDGTRHGYGLLLEPVTAVTTAKPPSNPQSSSTLWSSSGMRSIPTAEAGASTPVQLSLFELIRRTELPEEHRQRLVSVGLEMEVTYGKEEIEAAAKRAKLPLGHRLRLTGALRDLARLLSPPCTHGGHEEGGPS